MPSYQVASTFCHVVGCTFRHCLQVVSTVGMLARLACLTNGLAWTVTHHRQAVWLVEHFCKFVKQQASWHKACKYFADRHTVHAKLAQLRRQGRRKAVAATAASWRQPGRQGGPGQVARSGRQAWSWPHHAQTLVVLDKPLDVGSQQTDCLVRKCATFCLSKKKDKLCPKKQ